MTKPSGRRTKFLAGYRPVIHARHGLMLGIRQPMDGAVFEKLEDAENYCMDVMVDHFDRRLGPSDALIKPFKGLVDCGPPPDPTLLRDIERICEEVAKEQAKVSSNEAQ